MTTLEEMIAQHPFWAGVHPRHVAFLNRCASFERFGIGYCLFREGTEADRFYLVQTGQVALETFIPGRGETTIQTVGAGDVVGWSWLFPPHRWHFSGRAVDPVEVVAFAAGELRRHAQEDAEFGRELAMRVAQVMLLRLQATRRQLLGLEPR